MHLTTERLILRQFIPDDLEGYRLLSQEVFGDNSAADVHRDWMVWTTAGYRQHARLYQPPIGDYAITLKSGALIGSIGLVPSTVPWGVLPQFDLPDSPEHPLLSFEFGLFWAIRSAHQKQGYASEAASAFCKWAFETFHCRRLVATTERDNLASQAVMRKIGMTLYDNPTDHPFWFEVVGLLEHPSLR